MSAGPAETSNEQILLGRAIRFLRTREGMTQAEAAEAYGCDPKTWYRYEKGARDLTFDQLSPLAEAVGSTREELIQVRDHLAAGEQLPQRRRGPDAGVSEPSRRFDYHSSVRRQRVIDLPEGDVIFSYPSDLSAESRAEVVEHLEMLLKRFKS